MSKCPNCGEETQRRYCTECGYDMEPPQNSGNDSGTAKGVSKTSSYFKKNKKPIIIIAVALLVVIIASIALGVASSNIFKLGKISKIKLGMEKSQVEKVLGKADNTSDSVSYWFENSFAKKYAKVEKLLESDMEADFEKADKLYGELEKMTYKFIMVRFDDKKKVSEVFLDMQHKYVEGDDYAANATKSKKVKINTLSAPKKIEATQVDGVIKITTDLSKLSYIVEFLDGSYITKYVTNMKTEIISDNTDVKLKWSDSIAEYSETKELIIKSGT